MRVAIVGSGISGLTAAYLLTPHAEVTVYERESRLGGHAHTVDVRFGDRSFPVDTGFMVYNPAHYPYFVALLKELDIASVETVMSFSVSIPGDVEYSSSFGGLLGDMRQLVRPSYWRLLIDILRFNRMAKRYLASTDPDPDLTMDEFKRRGGFSRELVEWYRFPMMGSIWSAASKDLGSYPALETFRFLNNHMLLNVFDKPVWRTVKDGSRAYVRALESRLLAEGATIRRDTPITRIERTDMHATVSHPGGTERFDALIMATHPDTTLSLLADADDRERDALGMFSYTDNEVVLHSDTSFMPRRKGAWASWNYHTTPSMQQVISLTYCMNFLQHIPDDCPVFVTLNPQKPVDQSLIHGRYSYAHPVFDLHARSAQASMSGIQGMRRTYFAGAYLGFGFHEDGAHSAVRAVETLGFPVRLSV